MKNEYKYNSTLDIIKVIATILIIGSHCLPLFANDTLNFYYGQFFFRFCVPLFFLTSGYYFIGMNNQMQKSYIKRILLLYIVSTLLHVPLMIYNSITLKDAIYYSVFGYMHLWYLSALLFGLIIYYFINRIKKIDFIIIPLLLIGILFTEYYKLFDFSILNKIYDLLYYVGTSRNSLFFALPLIMIGGFINKNKEKIFNIKNYIYIPLLIISVIVAFFESRFLYKTLGYYIHLDLSIFNLFFPILLFIFTFKINIGFKHINTKSIRKICDWVYIIHVYIKYFIIVHLKVTHMKGFILVTIISFIISILLYLIVKRTGYKKTN